MRFFYSILFFFLFSSSAVASENEVHDVKWWKKQDIEIRSAFYEGYQDCYVWDVKNGALPNLSDDEGIRSVDNKISSGLFADGYQIRSAIESVSIYSKTNKSLLNGSDRHGENDGNLWSAFSLKERLIFIKGYTECLSHYKQKRFKKTSSELENYVSRYYGLLGKYKEKDGSLPDLIESKSSKKIGDLISYFLGLR